MTQSGEHVSCKVAAYIPDGVEDVEGIVELGLLWVVLDSEETRVAEVDPCNDSQAEDTIARRTLIDVQDQTRVKELLNTNMAKQMQIDSLLHTNAVVLR